MKFSILLTLFISFALSAVDMSSVPAQISPDTEVATSVKIDEMDRARKIEIQSSEPTATIDVIGNDLPNKETDFKIKAPASGPFDLTIRAILDDGSVVTESKTIQTEQPQQYFQAGTSRRGMDYALSCTDSGTKCRNMKVVGSGSGTITINNYSVSTNVSGQTLGGSITAPFKVVERNNPHWSCSPKGVIHGLNINSDGSLGGGWYDPSKSTTITFTTTSPSSNCSGVRVMIKTYD